MIEIFNRSHYESVLVERVHNLVPKNVWSKRYDRINEFEKLLVDEGTTILKFFLHISKQEQKERLQARLDDKKRHWKFDPNDLKERKFWNQYQEAYEDALRKCSTNDAPWYIVPRGPQVVPQLGHQRHNRPGDGKAANGLPARVGGAGQGQNHLSGIPAIKSGEITHALIEMLASIRPSGPGRSRFAAALPAFSLAVLSISIAQVSR